MILLIIGSPFKFRVGPPEEGADDREDTEEPGVEDTESPFRVDYIPEPDGPEGKHVLMLVNQTIPKTNILTEKSKKEKKSCNRNVHMK